MTDDRRFRAAERVAAKEVGSELMLLDLEEGSFFVARGTGPRVWDLVADGASVEEIIRTMAARDDKAPEEVRADVEAFVSDLVEGLPGRGAAGVDGDFGVHVVGRCYSRIEMAAVAWTAIGLLGTALAVLLGAYWRLGSRIEAQGADLGGRIDAQGRDLGERIDSLNRDLGRRIDAQTARIDALNARMDAHLEQHAS